MSRGRTYRHALERLLDDEPVERVVVPAGDGVRGDDIVWLLEEAPAEIVILRPDPHDRLKVSGEGVYGHF